jgi:membrane-bound lytic murein transglycosylase D
VAFWKKVFTKYTSTEGIIHDSNSLNVIYEVIPLEKPECIRARKHNDNRIENAKRKNRKILGKLAGNPSPCTREEKRVADLFGPAAKRADFRKAMDNIRCQVGLKDRFREGLIRSGAYIEEIKRIFRSHALPEDLAYLPHVESSFNSRAYSKFGAAGIWQFTLSTGKRFLNVDYTVDERWDPICSSHAAARLLKQGYEALGDWPMAITSYNHGIAGMVRAKKSRGGYEAIFKGYNSRSFKFASRNFYSEFLAARDVATDYKKYFGELPLERPSRNREVVLKGYASIRDLAHHFGVDTASLRTLNPALRAPVFNGEKYVPKGYTLRLAAPSRPNNLTASMELPGHLYMPRQKRSLFYKVRKGDTAGKIARMHGVRLSDLILANRLNSRAVIYAGQNLRIPAPNEKLPQVAMTKPVEQEKKEAPIVRPSASPGNQENEAPEGNISSQRLSQEQEVSEKPKEWAVNADMVSGNFLVESIISQRGKHFGMIRVQVGETLGHYADWLGIAPGELKRLNGFRPEKMIRLNERVKIPLEKASREAFVEKRFEYHKKIQDDFFASYQVKDVKVYTIRNGDNLWVLCHEVFEVPLWLLAKYNPGLNFNQLNPSEKLLVPLVEESKETQQMSAAQGVHFSLQGEHQTTTTPFVL